MALSADNGDLWTHYIYTILADPEMALWTAHVTPLTVTYPPRSATGPLPTVAVSTSAGRWRRARVPLQG